MRNAVTPRPGQSRCRRVVLLHSSAGSARQWEALADVLSPWFRVHAVEFHGHGRQRAWPNDAKLSLADEAALAAPFLGRDGGAHVVGDSYGGAVALKLASLFPDSVRSLVVYEPVMFGWLRGDPAAEPALRDAVAMAGSIRDRLARDDRHSAAQRFVDFWAGASVWDRMSEAAKSSVAARMGAVIQHFDALLHEPLSPQRLSHLGIPMLVLSGTRTVAVTHRIAQRLRAGLPLAQHDALPDLGHMGPITHADVVNRRIAAFLRSQAAGRDAPRPAADGAAERPPVDGRCQFA